MQRRHRGTTGLLYAVLAILVLALTACGPDDQQSEPDEADAEPTADAGDDDDGGEDGGTLRVANPQTIVELDPHGASSASRSTLAPMQHIMDSLVERDVNGDIVPRLATDWETPDELTWVFSLRDDAVFHDGDPVTAEDVKASLERVVEADGPIAPQWAALDSVEATDEHTVTIKTTEPLGTILTNLTLLLVGPADEINEEGFWESPIGSGPFKMVEFRPDERLVLEKNEDYWGEPPAYDRLEFVEIPEMSARMTALINGEVDLTWLVPPDQVSTLEQEPSIVFDSVTGYSYYFIWFNGSREPFTDPNVRRALWHAVDVQSMVDGLFGDLAEVATGPIPGPVFGSSENTPYEYDPDLAQQMLADAGYPDGFDTTMQWNSGCCPQITEISQELISAWSQIGVTVEPLEKERANWLEDLIALDWDLNLQTNTVLTGDADFTLGRLYISEANRNGYANDELDQLLIQARQSQDQSEREQLYAEAGQIIWDEAVGIFPMDLKVGYAWRDRVSNFEPTPNEMPRFDKVQLGG
jgi:peptide/nickel transport system substrate-binding protein